jgi:hypothetical protein
MRERLLALREARARLVERARSERESLASAVARADAVSEWWVLAKRVVDEASRHPIWIVAAVAALVALRPRRVARLLMGGWSLWRIYRRARRYWDRLVAPAPRAA